MASLIRSADISKQVRKLKNNSADDMQQDEPKQREYLHDVNRQTHVSQIAEPMAAGYQVETPGNQDLEKALARAEKAEEELKSLRFELDSHRSSASREGYEAGYEDGQKNGKDELKANAIKLTKVYDSLSQHLKTQLSNTQEAAIEVVYAAVTKILESKLVTHEGIKSVVKQSIKHINSRDQLIVHVSPNDLKILQSAADFDIPGLNDKIAMFVADERVTLGGCILETTNGSLDARLDLQLQTLKDCLLRNAVNNKDSEHSDS